MTDQEDSMMMLFEYLQEARKYASQDGFDDALRLVGGTRTA